MASLPKGAVFLSIQAQDFIEDTPHNTTLHNHTGFLSIQAQDFIEDCRRIVPVRSTVFLSIQAQDFIEDIAVTPTIAVRYYS